MSNALRVLYQRMNHQMSVLVVDMTSHLDPTTLVGQVKKLVRSSRRKRIEEEETEETDSSNLIRTS